MIYVGAAAQRVIVDSLDLGPEPSWQFDQKFGFMPVAAQRRAYLWPQGGMMTGLTPGVETVTFGVWYGDDWWWNWTGELSYPYRIRGYTLDSNGAILGNVTLNLFRTSDNAWIATTTSDPASGAYDFGVTDNTTAYFIVAYRPSPPVEGTTVNTLIGS